MPAAVPVLCYHAVTTDPGDHIAPFAVTPDDFRRQLDLLLERGYRCITFADLTRRYPSGEDPVAVLTFDDGYADFAESALPALQERGLASTLFVTTGWLEGPAPREPGPSDRMLAWSQLPELVDAGVEIGAHSHSHPQLDTLGKSALRRELVTPRALLEQALGREVPSFAYPHGYNGPRVRRLTRASGYRAAAAVRNRLHRPDESPFAISRLMLRATAPGTTPTAGLARWLDDTGGRYRTRESWTTTGWRMYRHGRAIVRRRPGTDYA